MTMFDNIKDTWNSQNDVMAPEPYDLVTFRQMVKDRVIRHNKMVLNYFWKSLLLQILVYVMVVYVLLTNLTDLAVLITGGAALITYIPFTISLLRKAQRIMRGPELDRSTEDSIHSYVKDSYYSIQQFFRFKRRSDMVLIPFSSLIGTYLTFHLFVPEGVYAWPELAGSAFVITLLSCLKAITDENKRNFKVPIQHMKLLLEEFETNN